MRILLSLYFATPTRYCSEKREEEKPCERRYSYHNLAPDEKVEGNRLACWGLSFIIPSKTVEIRNPDSIADANDGYATTWWLHSIHKSSPDTRYIASFKLSVADHNKSSVSYNKQTNKQTRRELVLWVRKRDSVECEAKSMCDVILTDACVAGEKARLRGVPGEGHVRRRFTHA